MDYVVKVFKEKSSYDQEVDIFQNIQLRTVEVNQQFIKKVHENPEKLSIVFSPYGKPVNILNRNILNQMLMCVEKLQECGVIHRDLSPHHFLLRTNFKDEQTVILSDVKLLNFSKFINFTKLRWFKIFLIDFGSAFLIDYNDQKRFPDLDQSNNSNCSVTYKGSIHFAAREILINLATNKKEYALIVRSFFISLIYFLIWI